MGNFHSVQFGNPAPAAAAPSGASEEPQGTYHGHKPRPFTSQEEMLLHTKDPRYSGTYNEQEKKFQSYVAECIGMTDSALLGGAGQRGVLEAAMGDPGHRDWQDPLNTLGTMTDIYRDMSEAHRDQSSPLYRSSAFERQRVAEKINRSVPDSAVESKRYNGSVKVGRLDPSEGDNSAIGYVSNTGETWTE